MKRLIFLLSALTCFWIGMVPVEEVEAYWGYRKYRRAERRRVFRPRFSLSLSGGIHFVDIHGDQSYGFSYGLIELGGHVWVHPNISLDLNVGTHLAANRWSGTGWGYVSFKPGVRFRLGLIYFRTALDLGVGRPQLRADSVFRDDPTLFLFGILIGGGIRIPMSRYVRFFAELTYQFNFSPEPVMMPFYGQLGFEVMF
ncbi:MAG: hypothetical protein AAGJ35_10855 [Myxococcota bacterium]